MNRLSSSINPMAPGPELTIPSFIPKDRLDSVFSSGSPGWSRYLSDNHEYRIFKEDGKLRAVQVIAGSGHDISVAELSLFIQELFGKDNLRPVGMVKEKLPVR
ncbi:MAG: hypothetical protein MZV70_68645 [Desulfobacterales bacterium]|nr:hypothetical protein [Desulfobacterales bacterium]